MDTPTRTRTMATTGSQELTTEGIKKGERWMILLPCTGTWQGKDKQRSGGPQHATLGGPGHPQQGLMQTILEVEKLLRPFQDAAHSRMRICLEEYGHGLNKKSQNTKNRILV
jgi:hypothetical protein